MNARILLGFLASLLIGSFVFFAAYSQPILSAPFVPIFHTGTPGSRPTPQYPNGSWCGPCNQFKGSAEGQRLNSLVEKGGIKYNDVNSDGTNLLNYEGSVPALEYEPGQFMNPSDAGFSAKLAQLESLAGQVIKQQDETICIVPRPGQSPAFGPMTDDHPVGGQVRDLATPIWPILESWLNFALRSLGSATMEIELAQAGSQKVEKGKVIMITPNEAQSIQFVHSMGGNASNRGSYRIGGVDVPVGKYVANKPDDKTRIVFDEACENPQKESVRDPKADPFAPLGGGTGNFGGSGGGGNGGGGLGGGLGMLQAMQGLFGSLGKNQFGNQNNQGLNQQQNQCALQPESPVCGTKNKVDKTYKNQCYLEQLGAQLKNTGVCVVAPAVSLVDSIAVLNQLSSSGIPASLLDAARNAVATVLSTITANTTTSETVVK